MRCDAVAPNLKSTLLRLSLITTACSSLLWSKVGAGRSILAVRSSTFVHGMRGEMERKSDSVKLLQATYDYIVTLRHRCASAGFDDLERSFDSLQFVTVVSVS